MNVVIIDYGMGNLRSIQFKLERAGVPAVVSSDHRDIAQATRLILPGVGHFAQAMKNLHERGLVELLTRKVMAEKTPILGICLGIQLFTRFSEEGGVPGLGWIAADTRKFSFPPTALRIPHIGWAPIHLVRPQEPAFGLTEGQSFYFVHSYHLVCDDPAIVLATAEYGYEYTCAIHQGNIVGTQFHPEKSHRSGFQILLEFAAGIRNRDVEKLRS